MKWNGLLKRYGYQVEVSGVEYDPFLLLAHGARTQDVTTAHVSCNVGTAKEYGEVKCNFTVSISCPQDEKSINMAGELAFRKAVELTNDGASHLGLPPLPNVPEGT